MPFCNKDLQIFIFFWQWTFIYNGILPKSMGKMSSSCVRYTTHIISILDLFASHSAEVYIPRVCFIDESYFILLLRVFLKDTVCIQIQFVLSILILHFLHCTTDKELNQNTWRSLFFFPLLWNPTCLIRKS